MEAPYSVPKLQKTLSKVASVAGTSYPDECKRRACDASFQMTSSRDRLQRSTVRVVNPRTTQTGSGILRVSQRPGQENRYIFPPLRTKNGLDTTPYRL